MVLDGQRSRGERLLGPLADKFEKAGWSADRVTWASLAFAFLAGLSFAVGARNPVFLLLGALLVLCNAAFDAVDGILARRTGTASPAGDFLDHALDRYADLFFIGGLAVYSGSYRWGLLAISGVFLTSYIATQASAVGLKRDYRGILGRADRLVLLTLVPIVEGALALANVSFVLHVAAPWRPPSSPFETITPVIGLLMTFAVLGNLTALQRFRRARRELLQREGRAGGAPVDPPPKDLPPPSS